MIRIPTRHLFAWLFVAAALALAVGGCTVTAPPAQKPATHQFGVQTKTSGCLARSAMPDPACTPGALMPGVTKSQICRSGYASSVRNVPQSKKDRAYAEYGVTHHFPGQYEVDHLVSLELGGSNDTANLWPEAASPTPGFHQKDRVENYLHDQVCRGAISLRQAQIEIATNWMQVYRQMPRSTRAPFAAVAQPWCSLTCPNVCLPRLPKLRALLASVGPPPA
jgi:hypothetical protein